MKPGRRERNFGIEPHRREFAVLQGRGEVDAVQVGARHLAKDNPDFADFYGYLTDSRRRLKEDESNPRHGPVVFEDDPDPEVPLYEFQRGFTIESLEATISVTGLTGILTRRRGLTGAARLLLEQINSQ